MKVDKPISRSLRDPDGEVLESGGRVYRFVHTRATATVESLLSRSEDIGRLVPAAIVPAKSHRALITRLGPHLRMEPTDVGLVLEHQKIEFPNYPYEWCPEMLYESGLLTLQMATEAIDRGQILKDATPYNILFDSCQPHFVDWLSFERRDPSDARWPAFAQYVRTFLMPLVANRVSNVPLGDLLTLHRDGLEPQYVYSMLGPVQKFTYFSLVTLPHLLQRNQTRRQQAANYKKPSSISEDQAKFILRSLIRFLRNQTEHLKPRPQRSAWGRYLDRDSPYDKAAGEQKTHLVSRYLENLAPGHVLDIGANKGRFSLLAAQLGHRVTAIDSDPNMTSSVFRHASQRQLRILPLCVDLARPTPGLGWKNTETSSFLERSFERFDGVLALAVLHHLHLGDGIPLEEIFDLLAQLTRNSACIEFVGARDLSTQFLARGRSLEHYSEGAFQKALQSRFEIVERCPLSGIDRSLYFLRKRTPRKTRGKT